MQEWRAIPGYEGYYEIARCGCIRTTLTRMGTRAGKILRWRYTSDGYPRGALHAQGVREDRPIHQLVMLTFGTPGPDGTEINHKDGNKGNPQLYNLEWLTHAENMKHAGHAALMRRGQEHFRARLTEEQVRAIRAEYMRRTMGFRKLAEKYGVGKTTIENIVGRKYGGWTWLT